MNMRLVYKIILAVVVFLAGTAFSYAQSSVSLKLIDEKTGEPVGFATVSLTVKGEDKAVKYVLSNRK